ncbi:MAG: peptidylprolyl isomerase [Hyphomicrobiales bacterium]|nr:MAG: peptidylprolyl isomerase [Hyphomicrobiales bacterium]
MVSLLNSVPSRRKVDRVRPVRVNGVTISRAAIAREVQNHKAETPADAWIKASRALAVRELLLQEARRLAIVPEPARDAEGRRETDDEALVRQLIAQEVKTPEPSDAECRRIFETQRARFTSPPLWEVRHILVPGGQDPAARADAQAKARAILEELTLAPDRFGALASAYSACPSGKVGGSLGQIGPGQTVPEFEEALAKLPVGAVGPEPVVTRYGFHVVLVDRRIDGKALPFEMAREAIARWLTERVFRTAVRQYIGLLAGRATLEGVELDGATSPLLQ